MSIIHHLAITASDLRASERFYDAVLAPVGFKKVLSEEEICGWESQGFELLLYAAADHLRSRKHEIYQPGFHHIAFRVGSRIEVSSVAKFICGAGGQILEGPQAYPDYPGDYFAVFFLDPDGFKLEVMCC